MAPGRAPASLWVDDGRFVMVRRGTSDWETFTEVFLDECYRDDFVQLFGHIPRPERVRTVVDAGANVGYSSVYFRRRYPEATVLALEPDDENFEILVRNTADDPQVLPIRGALWNTHERLRVVDDDAEANGVMVASANGADRSDASAAGTIDAFTVDDLLAMTPHGRIDVLKIDIEGAERWVFDEGAERWLGKVGLIFIELHDWKVPGCSHAYHDALQGFEYAEFSLGGTVGTLITGPKGSGM